MSRAPAQQAKQLSIATGGTGGIDDPLAGGFGTINAKELPGITATAEVTGGSLDNMKLRPRNVAPPRPHIGNASRGKSLRQQQQLRRQLVGSEPQA